MALARTDVVSLERLRPVTVPSRPVLKCQRFVVASVNNSNISRLDRRAALTLLVGLPALVAPAAALAVDAKAAAQAKEARKAALRAAAEDMRTTGKSENAFPESAYSVGEDHSPNSHSHQEEGAKTAKGA
eukprot:jgi/Botrbrau1/2236/Bobra.101_2s0064.1